MKPDCDCLNECGDDSDVAKGTARPCERYHWLQKEMRRSMAMAKPRTYALLERAADFIAGFEGDATQHGRAQLLADLRQVVDLVNGTQGATA